LQSFVAEIGLDADAFLAAFQSPELLELIRADADAASAAGLEFTPMIFINGRPIDIGK
jgi:predicted DsbA family dithiol-disulfide isomerase